MTHLRLHDKAHGMCCLGLRGSGKLHEQPQPPNLKPADLTFVKLQLPYDIFLASRRLCNSPANQELIRLGHNPAPQALDLQVNPNL
jgi:hypothetical protein